MRSFNERLRVATSVLSSQGLSGAGSLVPDLPVVQPHNIDFVGSLVLIMVLVLTVANSLAPKFAVGGHALNAVFFGSIMCILTGLNLVLIPPVAAGLLLT